jgi:hypothetical protein
MPSERSKKIRKDWNGKYQLLIFGDDVNIFGKNMKATEKNTEVLLETGREDDLEVNMEKPKYIFMSDSQNAG